MIRTGRRRGFWQVDCSEMVCWCGWSREFQNMGNIMKACVYEYSSFIVGSAPGVLGGKTPPHAPAAEQDG